MTLNISNRIMLTLRLPEELSSKMRPLIPKLNKFDRSFTNLTRMSFFMDPTCSSSYVNSLGFNGIIDVSTLLGNRKSFSPYLKVPEIVIDLNVVRSFTFDVSSKRRAQDLIEVLVQATM